MLSSLRLKTLRRIKSINKLENKVVLQHSQKRNSSLRKQSLLTTKIEFCETLAPRSDSPWLTFIQNSRLSAMITRLF